MIARAAPPVAPSATTSTSARRLIGSLQGSSSQWSISGRGGGAASAAAVLLSAGAPGKRLAVPNARVLIHQPYTEGAYGQASDIEIQANEILRMRALLEELIARHTGKDVDEVRKDIERDKILTTQEAIDYGLIDAFTTSRKASLVS